MRASIPELLRRFDSDTGDLEALWLLVKSLERAGRIAEAYLLCVDHARFPDPKRFRLMEAVKRRMPEESWPQIEDDFFKDQTKEVRDRQSALLSLRRSLGERLAAQQRPALESIVELEEGCDQLSCKFKFESEEAYDRQALDLRLPVLGLLMLDQSQGLEGFLRDRPYWRRLTPSRAALHDEILSHIPALSTLRQLSLPLSGGLTRAGLAAITQSLSLTALAFNATRLSDCALADLAPLHQLRELEISNCAWVRDQDLEALLADEALPRLRKLGLHRTAITGAILPRLCGFPALDELDLGDLFTDAALLEDLVRRGRLKSLSFFGSRLGDDVLELLASSSSLERLELCHCPGISLNGLRALRSCPRLEYVSALYCGVDQQGLKDALPGVEVEELTTFDANGFGQEFLAELEGHSSDEE